MKSEYCTQCGHKNIYSLKPPKFCGNCGEPLSNQSISRSNLASTRKKSVKLMEDETDIDYVPDIQGLDCEIEHNQGSYFKFESLFDQRSNPQGIARRDLKDKKPRENG